MSLLHHIFTFLKQFGSSAEIMIVGEQDTGTTRELETQHHWHFHVHPVIPVSSSTLNVYGHVPADGLVVVGDPWTLAGGAVEVSAID